MDASQPPLPPLPSLCEIETRMQVLRVSALQENQTGETLSQRAEWFYQRRPLILSLCEDLYKGYTTLLNHNNYAKPENPKPVFQDNDSDTSSEVTSILSYQQMQITTCDKHKIEDLVSQLVTANTEIAMAQDKLRQGEKKYREATKTIELLKKLVTLLDMEKEVAVEETANLGYKLTSLLEENRELATEALFMKTEAVRLARCVLKMRDDHFHEMCLLQNQVYALQSSSSRETVYENEASPKCFGLDKSKSKKRKVSETRSEPGEKKKRKSKWLKRLNPFVKCSVSPSPGLLHRPAQ
ncbi:kinase-interacting family protein-like [Raphanus sativus]|uniref:Kinase-interacting family protein-like n=1 Tax=Raphanus sativus TaxID=3726 RepID=A0A6J0KMK7_RAPSA|nr:kinase-interacting family protein-like [Raphanus sativus]